MKKRLVIVIMLIFILFPLYGQKTKDVLYLKNGSMVFGKLIEIANDQYKMKTSDGSIFIFPSSDVEKFAKETPLFDGRKVDGFGFALEAGLLAGAQSTEYSSPFSFNFLTSITIKTNNIISIGSGVEFIGKSFTPFFLEYKRLVFDKKTTPFIFIRGGALAQIGGNDSNPVDTYHNYEPYNYKGGASFTCGSGVSWAKEDYETYLSFAYRYANTSYQKNEYNKGTVTYKNEFNRLEIKFGFRF